MAMAPPRITAQRLSRLSPLSGSAAQPAFRRAAGAMMRWVQMMAFTGSYRFAQWPHASPRTGFRYR